MRFAASFGYGIFNEKPPERHLLQSLKLAVEPMPNPPPAYPDIATGEGPQAHEDLTIAEHLGSMRSESEHRPGEQCFLVPDGARHWVEDSVLERFLAENGSVHPSAFLNSHGSDWHMVLFTIS